MRRQTWLLAAQIATAASLGLLLGNVGYLFWSMRESAQTRSIRLLNVAYEASLIGAGGVEARSQLEALAGRHHVDLSLFWRDGSSFSTLSETPVLISVEEREHLFKDGKEHWILTPPHELGVGRVVASRSLTQATAELWSIEKRALGFIAALVVIIVLLSLLFLRRSVLEPMARLLALVANADRKGLSEYELNAVGSYATLSRGIISMTQRLEADRTRIATQLEALQRAHQELGAAQERLVRAERLAVVGQLAAGLAHEIGNPLTVVMGFVDVLKGSELTETQKHDALARMSRELDRIHGTVRDLLDFGRASVHAEGAGELCEVLEHVERLLRPQARFRGVELKVRGPAKPVQVPLDSSALTQVLLNLLLNAADAVAGTGQVSVDVTATTTSVAVVIEDSGPGVPEALRAKIFEPFFSTKAAGHGTGLGLAVVAHLVAAAGGDVQVETATLGGARFRVTLPVLIPAAQ